MLLSLDYSLLLRLVGKKKQERMKVQKALGFTPGETGSILIEGNDQAPLVKNNSKW